MVRRPASIAMLAAVGLWLGTLGAARAADAPTTPQTDAATQAAPAVPAPVAPEDWSLHAQTTLIWQGDFGFHSPYQGPNSLSGNQQWRETVTATGYIGRRLPWDGGAFYANPEINQGDGLSRGFGVGSYVNGDSVGPGYTTPRLNLARAFLRQTFGLGGEQEVAAPAANRLGESIDVNRLVVTAGKVSANDFFDDNSFAHDQHTQFINLGLVDAQAWDYPADPRGYTYGAAIEYNDAAWAFHTGVFVEPTTAAGRDLDARIWKHFGAAAQFDEHFDILKGAVLRELVFLNRANMGNYAQGAANGGAIVPTRRDRFKYGFVLNGEQAVTDTFGLFARAYWNDGRAEAWSAGDIDHGVQAGVSLKGAAWNRPDDTVGFAGTMNGISKSHRNYLAAGGTDLVVGDGKLSYAAENLIETYYSAQITKPVSVSFDYQLAVNPAFNAARGPVSVFAARLHVEY